MTELCCKVQSHDGETLTISLSSDIRGLTKAVSWRFRWRKVTMSNKRKCVINDQLGAVVSRNISVSLLTSSKLWRALCMEEADQLWERVEAILSVDSTRSASGIINEIRDSYPELVSDVRIWSLRRRIRKWRQANNVVGPVKQRHAHTWNTRQDPFEGIWEDAQRMLEQNPRITAQSILRELKRRFPDRITDTQERTLRKRVRRWREAQSPLLA